MRWLWLSTIVALTTIEPASAAGTDDVLAQSRPLLDAGRTNDAVSLLESQKSGAETYEAEFLLVRALAWSGRHADALERLAALEAAFGANSDTLLFRARIFQYQGRLAEARAQVRAVLAIDPENEEAQALQTTLQRVDRQSRWRLHTGAEFSTFRRRSLSEWRQHYLSVSHLIAEGGTSIWGGARHYRQFSTHDVEFEAGVNARLGEAAGGYAAFTAAPNAEFRPNWRGSVGGEVRVAGDAGASLWGTADIRYDAYDRTKILVANPGVRLAFHDPWRVGARAISVIDLDGRTAFGWDARLDGEVTNACRFFVGVADAPETVAAETVRTFSVFGGLSLDVTDRVSLALSAAREDRDDSYVRRTFHVGVVARF